MSLAVRTAEKGEAGERLKEENNESLKCVRRWDSLIERYESVYVTLPSAESNAEHVDDEWHVSGLTYS